ncbi:MAG TPA: beta-ketoacyl-[acyl-carrier-protein] synthase family protein [Gammaproteobacteria bacterium]|nr:beta-ketoacyl-[acyl-carrier-protein] synthase family protein [Gammaproteobacteria bacterium]
MRRVAVTGLGLIAPGGNDPETFFASLAAGKSAIRVLDDDWTERLTTRIAAPADVDASAHFPAPRLRMLDRVSQLALLAAKQAVANAALELADEERATAGVFFGTGMGGAATTDDGYATLYRNGSDRIKPFTVLLAMNNAAASWIGMEHGLGGPNLTYSVACSSSAVAIGEAWQRIASGAAPVALAGGAEAPLTLGTIKAWEALKTLAAEDPENPAASCKPFSKDRSGLVLGEGAAVVVLEDWERAARRGAQVLGEIVGYGLCTDAAHITKPTAEGQARAMRLALASARLAPDRVGYVNAHGTGTLANDGVETAAIRSVFGPHAERLAVSSTKSMHGHLLGAAGAVELVAALLALRTGTLPPTMHLRAPDPDCDLDYVPNEARAVAGVEFAMSNSFAFGGTNAVLVCRRV